jgi:(4-O-methyl)-D-glucuronate---lignin esterase
MSTGNHCYTLSTLFALVSLSALMVDATLAETNFPPPQELPSQADFPDPLVTQSGKKVATVREWETTRKPELRALFEHYMYGRYPARPEKVSGKTLFTDAAAFGEKGTLQEIEITFGPPDWPKIYLLIATPAGAGPFPCFVGANFGGNHLLTPNTKVRVPTAWAPDKYPGVVDNRATEAGRGAEADTWPLEQIISRGYAVATFYCGDVQPDRPGVREGMFATVAEGDHDPAQAGAIMWWAWGIHRTVDYLTQDDAIDAKRIAVVGHSRLGKTALLAGAFDDRIALTIANQAGCGGSGPSRHNDPKAETVARITKVFPHWFCDNFAQFGSDPTKLPFDQHSLVAICAPRPLLFTAAADDEWANPAGQFEVLKAAGAVYKIHGVEGLEAAKMTKPGDPLIASRLGYWIRPGEHAMSPPDWTTYMDFADRWLK